MNNFNEKQKEQFEFLKSDLERVLDAKTENTPDVVVFMLWTLSALTVAYTAIKDLQQENNLLKFRNPQEETFIN